jgi:hypothetical protein
MQRENALREIAFEYFSSSSSSSSSPHPAAADLLALFFMIPTPHSTTTKLNVTKSNMF